MELTNEVLVCVTGDSWDVVLFEDDIAIDTVWCQTKAEALKEARQLFNEHTKATKLRVESVREFSFKTIRSR